MTFSLRSQHPTAKAGLMSLFPGKKHLSQACYLPGNRGPENQPPQNKLLSRSALSPMLDDKRGPLLVMVGPIAVVLVPCFGRRGSIRARGWHMGDECRQPLRNDSLVNASTCIYYSWHKIVVGTGLPVKSYDVGTKLHLYVVPKAPILFGSCSETLLICNVGLVLTPARAIEDHWFG
ncbi:hypothetical protein EDD37DRAFT_434321 [Exophiala viscosa]|uniref:uncharacterized protein n=1 Tax=Exophiala viscosa TaxID=2486360 RepID=UPI0021950D06|nr:hypothetical protein EDD37DRAFT_434321 [Exophiala viscosa]